MILLLDTSTSICKLTLVDGEWRYHDEWRADRTLAKDLLRYLQYQLSKNNKSWQDVSAIGAFQGPGSFTGLRIGLTVLNTVAVSLSVPIVGCEGESWLEEAVMRLRQGDNDRLIMPLYGSEANITKPRK